MFKAEQLFVEAWHDSRLPEESLRTYLSRLRKKLKELGADAAVVNKSRKGYALTSGLTRAEVLSERNRRVLSRAILVPR